MLPEESAEEDPSNPPVEATMPQTVLIVEDEILIRLYLADSLRKAGYDVIEAATADEALDVLKSSQHIDLIATDIRMPGSVDGLGLAARLRYERPDLRIVVLSAHLAELPSADLADAFIQKPYLVNSVIAAIRKLLQGENHDGEG
jgi:CheY-like chemotaxis protein